MLTDVVQFADEPHEVVGVEPTFHVVGLYRLDECPHVLSESGESLALGTPITGVAKDPELQPFTVRGRINALSADRTRVDEMVECGANVVNGVTEQKAPGACVGFGGEADVDAVVAALAFGIDLDGVRVRFCPQSDLVMESLNVFPGPIQFGLNIVERTRRAGGVTGHQLAFLVMKPEPTQTTEEGLEISVPKRGDVLDALRKAAKIGKDKLPPMCDPIGDED